MTAEQRASMYMLEKKENKTCSDYKLLDEWKDLQIKELLELIEKMKMCCNCEKWRNWKEEFDDISYPCSKHNATDKCTLWKLKEN